MMSLDPGIRLSFLAVIFWSGVCLSSPTFIIWIHGDADHLVPLDETRFRNADDLDVSRVSAAASTCLACNVLLLHDKRGGRADLTVFQNGNVLESRTFSTFDAVNPFLLVGLITKASQKFPGTETHLIFRGHSFVPRYEPGRRDLQPFDEEHPESPFGIDEFASQLTRTGRWKFLRSITFASCRMAYFDVAAHMAPFANDMIASQVDLLEGYDVGFGYNFIKDQDHIVYSIWSGLMEPFLLSTSADAKMMEFPMSLIHLDEFMPFHDRVAEFLRDHRIQEQLCLYRKNHRVQKVISQEFAAMQSQENLAQTIQIVRSDSSNLEDVDIGSFFDFLIRQNLSLAIETTARELKKELGTVVQVSRNPPWSEKYGLSL